jgi:SAM-dependent methyltransferase
VGKISEKEKFVRIRRIRTLLESDAHRARSADAYRQHAEYLQSLTPPDRTDFTIPGYSYPAGRTVDFLVTAGPDSEINWRETVICPQTRMNNRVRASLHLFDAEMETYPDSAIYLTEQTTPTYGAMASLFKNLVGSEYLGQAVPLGSANEQGIRNEDMCALSFADESLDCIVSLDVFEHIPAFADAFKECCRCLKRGGRLMWSVPFDKDMQANTIRATIDTDGSIRHLLPPQYHGDPMSPEGVLCFTIFGWEMLELCKSVGFRDAYAVPYQSLKFGYLGPETEVFFARK